MVEPPAGPITIEPPNCVGATPDESCNATVSEVETCLTAMVHALEDRVASIDCSIAGNAAAIMRISQAVPSPTECTRLEATCPNAVNGF